VCAGVATPRTPFQERVVDGGIMLSWHPSRAQPSGAPMFHPTITIVLAFATLVASLTAAWYWLKSSRVEIGTAPSMPSISDIPEVHILEAQVAIIQSSAINAKAARWTAAAAVLGAVTSVWGAV
jgi:hypothetical protein